MSPITNQNNTTTMRKNFMIFVAAAMLLGTGLMSCERDDDNSSSSSSVGGGNGGGDNGGGSNSGGQTSARWVDLGLPSGLLWAECNVGASSPEDYGNYYAWGETTTKSVYNWNTYCHSNGDSDQLTKYCNDSNYGYNDYMDNLTILQPGDDVATVNMGSEWRTPTMEEWQELIDNTQLARTMQNGVYGIRYIASNGQSLFMPAAGYRWGGDICYAGERGNYWTSSLYPYAPLYAWYFGFLVDGQNVYGHFDRFVGFSVRAVRTSLE